MDPAMRRSGRGQGPVASQRGIEEVRGGVLRLLDTPGGGITIQNEIATP